MLRKLITTAALALGLLAVTLAPAEARGFGGVRGGGFHAGGFRGGFGGFHPGFGGFHRGFAGGFHPGFGFQHRFAGRFRGAFPFFGLGVLGAGYAAGYPNDYYGYSDYGYGGCYLQREWLWNGYRYVNQLVRVCQ